MHLSIEEKNIILDIARSDSLSIYDFVSKNLKYEIMTVKSVSSFYAGSTNEHGSRSILRGSQVLVIDDKDYDKIIQFIAVWHILEKENMILTINSSREDVSKNASTLFELVDENVAQNAKMFSLCFDYIAREIIVLPKLQQFIDRDFLTNDEYDIETERKIAAVNMEFAQKNAKQGFWLAIGIAVLTSIISSVITYEVTKWSDSKENNVIVSNFSEFNQGLSENNETIMSGLEDIVNILNNDKRVFNESIISTDGDDELINSDTTNSN